MIYKTTSPLSPEITILIDGVSVNYQAIYGAELILEENKHDFLVLNMTGVPPERLLEYIDAPIYFVLNSGTGRVNTFTGYVSNIEPVNSSSGGFVNGSPFQEVRVYCIGTSYLMKGTKSARWSPPTLKHVVQTLAKRYELSADIPVDSYSLNDISQIAESDWAFLVKVVDRYGYKVTIHGTHIHVWDIYGATGRVTSYHDLVAPSVFAGAQPGTILSFTGTFGSLSASGGASATSTSFLDNQGRTLHVSSKDLRNDSYLGTKRVSDFEDFISVSASSFQEAQREVARVEKDDMPFDADVVVAAGGGILPGGIVSIMNYGTEFDGRWYVKYVRHEVHQNHYITHLRLCKDGVYEANLNRATVSRLTSAPEPKVIERQWVATRRRITEYV
jgi:hypothetical protein